MADKMQALYARCWKDQSFKKRFVNETAAVLAEEGFDVPQGVTIKVVENTPGVMNLVIPINPEALSDNQLDQVAGGAPGHPGFGRPSGSPGGIVARPIPTKSQGKECVPW